MGRNSVSSELARKRNHRRADLCAEISVQSLSGTFSGENDTTGFSLERHRPHVPGGPASEIAIPWAIWNGYSIATWPCRANGVLLISHLYLQPSLVFTVLGGPSQHQASRRRKGTPGLRGRSINAAVAYIHESSTLPTKSVFHVLWEVTGARIASVWGGSAWWRYFKRVYLRSRPAGDDSGTATMLGATWHFGAGAGHVRGHGPSQQPPEQGHAHLKRCIAAIRPNGSMVDVLQEIEKCVEVWSDEPLDQENAFSLLAPASRLGLRPDRPDSWMMHEGKVLRVPGRNCTMRLPSIEAILAASQATCDDGAASVQRIQRGDRIFGVMAMGVQKPVEPAVAQGLVRELQTKNVANLRALWEEHGVIGPAADSVEAAPLKVFLEKLRERWGGHCVVMQNGTRTHPTCWYACRTGHCPHEYAVQELAGLAQRFGAMLRPAREGAQALREDLRRRSASRGSSAEAGRRPKRRCKA